MIDDTWTAFQRSKLHAEGLIVIDRAQHEALMAAAKALELARVWEGFAMPNRVRDIIGQALAALRAAGLGLEEKHD